MLVGENFFANTVKRESNLKADLLQSSRNLESHSACSNKYYDENRLTSSSAVRFSGNAVNHFFKENDFQQKTEKTKFSPLNKKEENDNDTYMNLKKSFEQILVKNNRRESKENIYPQRENKINRAIQEIDDILNKVRLIPMRDSLRKSFYHKRI